MCELGGGAGRDAPVRYPEVPIIFAGSRKSQRTASSVQQWPDSGPAAEAMSSTDEAARLDC